MKVSFTVANTGRVGASEIAQVYVNDKISSVARPVKELKDYGKVYIPAGKSVRMTFVLGPDAFSFYDVNPGLSSLNLVNSRYLQALHPRSCLFVQRS